MALTNSPLDSRPRQAQSSGSPSSAQCFDTLRARRVLPRQVHVDHRPGPSEPLLWLPDAVFGAVVADRCAEPEYLKPLAHLIETHYIGP